MGSYKGWTTQDWCKNNMALIKQWYAEKTKKITPNLCISEPPKGRETEQALSYAHAKNQATKLHMVITFNESSISKYLWWGLFGKNEKNSFISFWTLPCIETEQQNDKSSAFGPGPADCSRRKHTSYSKSGQVRAQGRRRGGSGKGCRKGCHAFTWWPGPRATMGVPSPNPYCSIVMKACKQEPPSVTSEWFEQTNIITRVFMEKCLSTEAERA